MKFIYIMILILSLFLVQFLTCKGLTVPCENPTTCPEDFCTPPMITRCINFICLCDGPEYAEPEYDGPVEEYDHKGDFLRVKPKIINENMMMRERHMMKEIEV